MQCRGGTPRCRPEFLFQAPRPVSGGVPLLVALISACTACGSDILPPPPPADTTPPQVTVLFPNGRQYDEDGDGFVDLRVTVADPGGLVDPVGMRVRSLRGVNGPAGDDANLLDSWPVTTRDTALLVAHETIANLLHGGENALEISVPDTAGNVALDTIRFSVPHGALLRTLQSGLSYGAAHGVGVVVCPDDNRVYMAAGKSLVVADAATPGIIGAVEYPLAPDNFYMPLCVPGDAVLYVTLAVMRFDRTAFQWISEVKPAFASIGVVQSRADPNLLYVGESYTGGIGIIDRARAARIGSIPLQTQSSYEFVGELAVLPGDAKIYASRLAEQGILVARPSTGEILARIAIGGPNWPGLGVTDAFVLSHDDRWLYVAVLDGDPRGVAMVDTRTDSVVRTLPLPDYVPQDIDLSPSGNRLFVTTQDRWLDLPSQNVLIDVPTWRVLEAFPRPRPDGVIRFDGGVAFRPDGKLAFVAHNLDIDVYLIRE